MHLLLAFSDVGRMRTPIWRPNLKRKQILLPAMASCTDSLTRRHRIQQESYCRPVSPRSEIISISNFNI